MMTPEEMKAAFDEGYAGAWVDSDIVSCTTDIAEAAGIAAVARAATTHALSLASRRVAGYSVVDRYGDYQYAPEVVDRVRDELLLAG
jgi:hypothetical protein